jgi:hypothetical protein
MVAETWSPNDALAIRPPRPTTVIRRDLDWHFIKIAFGCGAQVRLRGEVSSETLRRHRQVGREQAW